MGVSLNLLVVDDSEEDRFLFRHAWGKTGCHAQIFEAEDGYEALDYLQNEGRFADAQQYPLPDVLFLDLKMPGRDGFEVLRWIKEHMPSLKVVVLSGSELATDKAQAQALGASAYMVKPPTPKMLTDHVLGCQQITA